MHFPLSRGIRAAHLSGPIKNLKNADGVEENNEDGDGGDVTDKSLPGEVEGGIVDVELRFGAFSFHEPAGKQGHKNPAKGEHKIRRHEIQQIEEGQSEEGQFGPPVE